MTEDISKLPPGWSAAPLGELTRLNPRSFDTAPTNEQLVSFVPMAFVEEESGRLNASALRPWKEVRKGYTPFQDGDVLFAKITPCMENGKYAIARGLKDGRGAGSTEFHVLRPHRGVAPALVLNYLFQDSVRSEARRKMKGAAGQLRVPPEFLRDLVLPLPPEPEQERIVQEMEKQFTRLDAAVAALRRVQANLKRYRASVLKAACEGRLVPTEAELARRERRSYEPASVLLERILAQRRARWEATQLIKGQASKLQYKQASEPELGNLYELAEGWVWSTLSSLAEVKLGKMLSPKAYEEGLVQLPYLRNENIRWGHIDYTDVKLMGFKDQELARYQLKPQDLVVCEGGEAGRCAIYTCEPGQYMYQKALHRVRPWHSGMDPLFIQYCLWHYKNSGKVIPRPSETTIQHLPLEEMERLPIPIPPAEEQRRIVAAVELNLSMISEIEGQLGASLKRAEKLRQGILKRAFEGNLVPQDPNDGSASLLLERIRAQRNAAPTGSTANSRRSRKRESVHV